jgi:2-polyprenyl-6-methoxyphenol hydroxylase-like FAD-dependent oxidoreductase
VLREQVAQAAPFLRPWVGDVRGWEDVKLLSVAIDRLTQWSRPGLLCIGDAAHAMSPVGGVGINLAIQDAVASANLLAGKLLAPGPLTQHDLEAVRRRRLWPTKVTQALQSAIQRNVLVPVIEGRQALKLPLPLVLVSRVPALQRLVARLLGLGLRPEHVASTFAAQVRSD